MCGLTGYLSPGSADEREFQKRVEWMTHRLVHRGPDDSGTWVDAAAGVALGARRLAIVDLSPTGRQPMVSSCGRFVIAYNGEVYNFLELRKELEIKGRKFRGHSDTEVILEAVGEWGLPVAVKKFVGMFAMAVWDRQGRTLYLVRDRLGIKPLYYGWAGKTFLFGSELKALRANPDFIPEIDRNALALLMRHNCVPQPYCIYKGILQLPAGTFLTLRAQDRSASVELRPTAYWSAKEVAERGAANPFRGSETEAIEQLDALLREAVKLRMVADVPLGAFLSGGIDSSTVVALMQAASPRAVKTFTIGFHEDQFNEAVEARAVAMHLQTDHTELYVTPEEAQAVIPKLPALYDEPFSDSSQIPTYLISALARQKVTVSLSGDGGDELFGGYTRYPFAQKVWRRTGWLPRAMRKGLARGLSAWEPETYDRRLGWLTPLLNPYGRRGPIGDKFRKLADVLAAEDSVALYRYWMSHWQQPAELVLGAQEPSTVFTDRSRWADLPNYFQKMMFFDLVGYLPDDILTKVDRASMGVSLEARVPLLDHRVVEFAARLPLSMKFRNGQGKWALRQVLGKYVPRELIERPKMGFAAPIDAWLRGPLRDWAEALLDERRLKQDGYLNSQPIRVRWAEHLSGRRNWDYCLWDVLMFQAWREWWG